MASACRRPPSLDIRYPGSSFLEAWSPRPRPRPRRIRPKECGACAEGAPPASRKTRRQCRFQKPGTSASTLGRDALVPVSTGKSRPVPIRTSREARRRKHSCRSRFLEMRPPDSSGESDGPFARSHALLGPEAEASLKPPCQEKALWRAACSHLAAEDGSNRGGSDGARRKTARGRVFGERPGEAHLRGTGCQPRQGRRHRRHRWVLWSRVRRGARHRPRTTVPPLRQPHRAFAHVLRRPGRWRRPRAEPPCSPRPPSTRRGRTLGPHPQAAEAGRVRPDRGVQLPAGRHRAHVPGLRRPQAPHHHQRRAGHLRRPSQRGRQDQRPHPGGPGRARPLRRAGVPRL